MMHFHDPIRQLGYLQQSLSQARKPIGLFLSAGCPLAVKTPENKPLIPDIEGLTNVIIDVFNNSEYQKLFQRIIKNFEYDERPKPNIEDILSHIRSLNQVAGRGEVRGLKADELSLLDDNISKKIVEIVSKSLPNNDTPYHKLAMWIGAIPRTTEPVEIFTTNYDLLMEQALEELRVPYFDGFIGSRDTFFDSYSMEEDRLPSRWARLWKLHGSINWRQNEKGIVSRGEKFVPGDYRYIIQPSHLKYDESRRMPYLAMIDRLRSFFKKPNAILVINGFSFGDDHLNEILLDSLRTNSTAIIFALVYGEIAKYQKAIKMASTTHNFNLLAKDEAIIGTRCAPWMEKEKCDTHVDYSEIEWVPKKDSDSLQLAHFKLGDFQVFGNLLSDLIGQETKEDKEKKN
jgi:hypothetical protein